MRIKWFLCRLPHHRALKDKGTAECPSNSAFSTSLLGVELFLMPFNKRFELAMGSRINKTQPREDKLA